MLAARGDIMYKNIKRLMDIILSIIGIVICAIPMLIVAVIIKLDSPGPVFFRQARLGLHGKEFKILKFRSMCVNAEFTGSGVYSGKSDSRVTRVGKIIRATSIDEIPQLFNVLAGSMSFIGPRPPLTYHPWPIEEYTEEQRKMFEVRPGITGWAQVNGYRGNTSIRKRIDCDLYYIENWTVGLDIKILFLTVFRGFVNKNAY